MKDEEEKVIYVPKEEDYSPELFDTSSGFNYGL